MNCLFPGSGWLPREVEDGRSTCHMHSSGRTHLSRCRTPGERSNADFLEKVHIRSSSNLLCKSYVGTLGLALRCPLRIAPFSAQPDISASGVVWAPPKVWDNNHSPQRIFSFILSYHRQSHSLDVFCGLVFAVSVSSHLRLLWLEYRTHKTFVIRRRQSLAQTLQCWRHDRKSSEEGLHPTLEDLQGSDSGGIRDRMPRRFQIVWAFLGERMQTSSLQAGSSP